MKRARVRSGGVEHAVTVQDDGSLRTSGGAPLDPEQVTWLPPATGTFYGLGLNYADHAAELASKRPSEPLVFIKTASALVGHRGTSCCPDGVENMHFEGELVAVIGRIARSIPRRDALRYVGGYTISNDYAVRDYLENYFRPNLRVKNRDALTPLGPWIVDARDVPDPHHLEIRTLVNGVTRQQGNTAGMLFDIPFLVEYLSGILTLYPGDMISTGTPEGVSRVVAGDEVVVEIEGIGRLENRIVSEKEFYGVSAAG